VNYDGLTPGQLSMAVFLGDNGNFPMIIIDYVIRVVVLTLLTDEQKRNILTHSHLSPRQGLRIHEALPRHPLPSPMLLRRVLFNQQSSRWGEFRKHIILTVDRQVTDLTLIFTLQFCITLLCRHLNPLDVCRWATDKDNCIFSQFLNV
jgi:hypothetical protein